jgi:parallel beta-helix repeat protein
LDAKIDGVLVESTVTDTLLKRNIAIGAGDDGIDIDSTTTSLRRNTANGNGDLGIEAVSGVTDLGGNTASGNGNPLQCQNVFCQ